jgi:transcription elongation factor GreB
MAKNLSGTKYENDKMGIPYFDDTTIRARLNKISPAMTIQQKTRYITREGYQKLQEEHDRLWQKERPEVTKIVTWAASLGDRSENADYQYNKRKLREIDRRVRYLRKILEDCKIVDYNPQQEGQIFFGAWVELVDDNDQNLKFRIVGADEIYGRNDYISTDSPMARACLKKAVDDEVVLNLPDGKKIWYVTNIYYIK